MNREKSIEKIFLLIACSALFSLGLITVFIFKEGMGIFLKIGFGKFIFSPEWAPGQKQFGLFSMIIGSMWVTIGALVIGVPLSLFVSIFLAEFCPKKIARILKPAIELLAGIPSVVYGFIGVVILAPLIREYLGGPGLSVLAGSMVLAIMILPTVISISLDAIQAVPKSYLEGSLALGATRWQSVYMVIIPAAKSGIIASVILGMGRAVGETMAVIMVSGNAVRIPYSVLEPVRTLTSNIALELGYATGMHREALFGTGMVLFVIIMILNVAAYIFTKRKVRR
ncbi:MAG: phosphate ABC transporter permease subunit PstC [bacterium]